MQVTCTSSLEQRSKDFISLWRHRAFQDLRAPSGAHFQGSLRRASIPLTADIRGTTVFRFMHYAALSPRGTQQG
eukprot:3517494-Rhodomonas_salina.1